MKAFKTFQAGYTKQGLPAFWEKRYQNGDDIVVEILCDDNFQPLRPVFLNRSEKIDKMFHMLFSIKEGDYILVAKRNEKRNKDNFTMFRILEINQDERKKYTVFCENVFSSDLVDDFEEHFGEAVNSFLEAALSKIESETVDSFFTMPNDLEKRAATAK